MKAFHYNSLLKPSYPVISFLTKLLFLAMLGSMPLHANISLTPAQIAAFQQLSDEEKVRLADQLGLTSLAADQFQDDGTIELKEQKPPSVQPRLDLQLDDLSKVKLPTEESDDDFESGLFPFGYSIFAGDPTTFAPVNDVPVSDDYLLGVGDSLKINIFGKENHFYELQIDSEGQVYIPELGPFSIAGLRFSEAKKTLSDVIEERIIGVRTNVAMGNLRTIRVFVLGEAHQPGSYVISSLSTITNALFLSGGVALTGSLRTIQLKRRGDLVSELDLYDLLLAGDTSGDMQLRSGDVVFIPPLGPVAKIDGQVLRPAIYELEEGDTFEDLIYYAGGLKDDAVKELAQANRQGQGDELQLLNLDLASEDDLRQTVLGGDSLTVPQRLGKLEKAIFINGHVLRPGPIQWRPGLRISDVLNDVDLLQPDPDLRYGLIKRYDRQGRTLSVESFSLSRALSSAGGSEDLVLEDQDEVIVFGLYEESRLEQISKIVDLLRAQADAHKPSQFVSVTGDVRYPGDYPLETEMVLSDLIEAAGGLTERAYQLVAELSRTTFDERQERGQIRKTLDLSAESTMEFMLSSRDVLQVKTIPEWSLKAQVELSGEVKFPGTYSIYKGDTLTSVIDRAGGLTEYAYAEGAVFTREDLRLQQSRQITNLQKRLAADVAKAEINISAEERSSKSDLSEAQALLDKLQDTEATGRLVIDLPRMLRGDRSYQVLLRNGDELSVPRQKNSVTVLGEVQLPISQVYDPGLGYWDYVERSGGTTESADLDRAYIVRANGSVKIPDSSNWFAEEGSNILPGDTIVVPLDADRVEKLVLWRDLSQIFYQIALGAAAVGSL